MLLVLDRVVEVAVVDKKSIHLKLNSKTHLLLKNKLQNLNLSMQEVMEHLSQLIVNSELDDLLNKYVIQKVDDKIKLGNKEQLLNSDIFTYIAYNSPLNREK